MRCQEASELLAQRVDRALPPADDSLLALHLQDCPECRRQAEMLARLDALLASAPVAAPGPQFAQGVLVRVQGHRRQRATLRTRVLVFAAAILAAGVIGLALYGTWSPAASLAGGSPLISALVGVTVRIGSLLGTLLGAGSILGRGLLGSPGAAVIAGLLVMAVLLALAWLRAVNRASLALARRTA